MNPKEGIRRRKVRKAVEYLRFGGMTEDEIRRLIAYVRKEGDVPSPQTAWT